MARNSFRKKIWLYNLLKRQGPLTLKEINEYWRSCSLNEAGEDYPRRTFQYDLNAISDMLDVDIVCDRRNNKYEIQPCGNSDAAMERALGFFEIRDSLVGGDDWKKYLLFDEKAAGEKFLPLLLSAYRERKKVRMIYISYSHSGHVATLVSPYCLKLYRQRWYLLAKPDYTDSMRTFALDRVESLELTHDDYSIPPDFCAKEYFSDYVGVSTFAEGCPELLKIKATALQAKYFRSLPLHHSQHEVESNPDYSVFTYNVVITPDLIRELYFYHDDIEILAPSSLAQHFGRR